MPRTVWELARLPRNGLFVCGELRGERATYNTHEHQSLAEFMLADSERFIFNFELHLHVPAKGGSETTALLGPLRRTAVESRPYLADGQTVARRARHLRSEEWPQKAQDAQNLNPSDRHFLSAILEPCEPLVANS